jgi:type IV secretory pathway VirB10-like protein
MAKKNFDAFLNTVNTPKPSPADIEAMAREIHQPKPQAPALPPAQPRKPAAAKASKPASPRPVAEPVREETVATGRRGRKPKPREAERLIRVSVDLPESLFIALGARCVREKTDKKTYVRALVERDLEG